MSCECQTPALTLRSVFFSDSDKYPGGEYSFLVSMLSLQRLLRSQSLCSLCLLFFAVLLGRQYLHRSSMPALSQAQEVASTLLAEVGLRVRSLQIIQSLWAGYGQICRIEAAPDATQNITDTPHETQSFILKLITPPPTRANDEGHTRKILSYQVEQYFYSYLAPHLPDSIPVARCLASINQHQADGTTRTAMILSDLKQNYPVAGEKRDVLTETQIIAALDWLSGFHGFWWSRVADMKHSSLVLPPLQELKRDGQYATKKSVWLNGGYTYLDTRRSEYATLANNHGSEWSQALTKRPSGTDASMAEFVASFLSPSLAGFSPIEDYETLIHGDVKSENLFTSTSGEQVAFYDFQYTGLGLGVCDLAKLFTCSVPMSMLVAEQHIPHQLTMQDGERKLLARYWTRLQDVSGKEYDWPTFVLHWEIALVDWLRFQASWGFWGNTQWLEARVRCILTDPGFRAAVVRKAQHAEGRAT